MPLNIEYIALDALLPYIRNSRVHSDEQVAQIAASIHEFGFVNPCLVGEDGVLIAGHGRLSAARKLGMDKVPCIRLEGLSEAQKRALVIADNRISENSSWDDEMLAVEIAALQDDGFDLDLLGFDAGELEGLMRQVEPIDLPKLPTGGREPFQQMTFTLHDDQAEQVKAAIDTAKTMGEFIGTGNENSNGNALSRICEMWLSSHV